MQLYIQRSRRLCSLRVLTEIALSKCKYGNDSIQAVELESTYYYMPHSDWKAAPIVLMHGISVSRNMWRRTARMMSIKGNRQVFVLDARNHGSSPHSPYHSPAYLAADVALFVKNQKLNQIVAIGHSMGGRAMMTLALTRPELVESAIIVDITPGKLPARVSNLKNMLRLMVAVLPTVPTSLTLTEARQYLNPKFSKVIHKEYDVQLILMNLRKLDNSQFAWKLNPQAILNGWRDSVSHYEETLQGLPPYNGKTLLLAADKAEFVTAETISTMEKYFTNLHVVHMDSDHQMHLDRPNEFIEEVVNFTRTA